MLAIARNVNSPCSCSFGACHTEGGDEMQSSWCLPKIRQEVVSRYNFTLTFHCAEAISNSTVS